MEPNGANHCTLLFLIQNHVHEGSTKCHEQSGTAHVILPYWQLWIIHLVVSYLTSNLKYQSSMCILNCILKLQQQNGSQ
jgi:hypothetical protein